MSRRKLEGALPGKAAKALRGSAAHASPSSRPRALSVQADKVINTRVLVDEVMATLRRENLQYIQLMFTDHTGELRCLEEKAEQLPFYAENGVGVDGSSIPGYGDVDKSDVKLIPECDTFRCFRLGEEQVAIVMCHIETADGMRHPHDPRNVLFNVIEQMKKYDMDPYCLAELEFFLLDDGEPVVRAREGQDFAAGLSSLQSQDQGGYLCVPPEDGSMVFRHELAAVFEDAGIRVKRLHHEVAPGQNEVELNFARAMRSADDTLLGIWLTRMMAHEYGISAEFSPKFKEGMNGSGLHQHVQCADSEGNNVFAGHADQWLSEKALHFIAGMIKYADDVVAVQSRSQASFDRMKPGHEAPSITGWDFMNRSGMIRLPLVSPGDEIKTRIEYRAGDASGAPHLLVAALLLAGLKGVVESIECPPKTEGNMDHFTDAEIAAKGLHRLPNAREECLDVLKKSAFVKELIGESGTQLLIDHWKTQK